MNAANEIAVEAFLNKQISFLKITDIIEESISKIKFINKPLLEDYIITDKETRLMAKQIIDRK